MKFIDVHGVVHEKQDVQEVPFRPAAYAIAQNAQAQVLIISDERSGKWELPGGGLDIGEDFPTCAKREVLEETGYTISVDAREPLLCDTLLSLRNTGECVQEINIFYTATLIDTPRVALKLDDEEKITESKFVDAHEFDQLELVHYQRRAWQAYLERRVKK